MKFRTLLVRSGDDCEDVELPQGWTVLGRAFDRGDWYILLTKETNTAKAMKQAELVEVEGD